MPVFMFIKWVCEGVGLTPTKCSPPDKGRSLLELIQILNWTSIRESGLLHLGSSLTIPHASVASPRQPWLKKTKIDGGI